MNEDERISDEGEPVLELELDEKGIDELIEKLEELKETKEHIHFALDDEHEILVHYAEEVID